MEIENRVPNITYLSFMGDLTFLAVDKSMVEIKKLLKKAGKITLAWGTPNAVTYDIAKTEAILFSKARKPNLVK